MSEHGRWSIELGASSLMEVSEEGRLSIDIGTPAAAYVRVSSDGGRWSKFVTFLGRFKIERWRGR